MADNDPKPPGDPGRSNDQIKEIAETLVRLLMTAINRNRMEFGDDGAVSTNPVPIRNQTPPAIQFDEAWANDEANVKLQPGTNVPVQPAQHTAPPPPSPQQQLESVTSKPQAPPVDPRAQLDQVTRGAIPPPIQIQPTPQEPEFRDTPMNPQELLAWRMQERRNQDAAGREWRREASRQEAQQRRDALAAGQQAEDEFKQDAAQAGNQALLDMIANQFGPVNVNGDIVTPVVMQPPPPPKPKYPEIQVDPTPTDDPVSPGVTKDEPQTQQVTSIPPDPNNSQSTDNRNLGAIVQLAMANYDLFTAFSLTMEQLANQIRELQRQHESKQWHS